MKNRNNTIHLWPTWLAIILGVAILWRNIIMNEALIPTIISVGGAILVALIGGIVTLIVANRQLKRDSQTLSEIRQDTSVEIKPKVDNIDYSVKAIAPSIIKIEDRSAKIDTIASAVDHFQFLKDQSGIRQEELMAKIAKLFDTNSQLAAQQIIDQQTISKLTLENLRLSGEVDRLRQQLRSQEQDEEFQPEM